MLENNGSDLDVERIMYEIRYAVARQHSGASSNNSHSSALLGANDFAQNGDSLRLQPPFQPKLDNRYHVNDLLRFHGVEFVRNAYLALLLREPDAIGAGQHLEALASGRFNKLDVLASLYSSPERRSKVRLDGMAVPVVVRRLGRVPIIGYVVRLITAVARLPLLVQHQNRVEFYLWSQLQRIVDYQNQSKHETTETLMQISAQLLEGMQRAADQQQALESALAQYEVLNAQQVELKTAIEVRLAEMRADLNQATTKLTKDTMQLFQREAIRQERQADQTREQLHQIIGQQQQLQAELREQERKLTVLLEEVGQNAPGSQNVAFAQSASVEEGHLLDGLYAAFENRFRGAPEEIERRLEVYLPVLTESHITNGVLDLGCGRGEWLRLMRNRGIECQGLDRNRLFIEECRRDGLNVIESDAVAYLRNLPPNSLNVVTSFHLVEHLPLEVLIKLIDEIKRTLKPAGLVILETPNPENFMVGSCCFYTDPTHRNPIPSQTLQYLLEARGFVDPVVMKLRPWDAAKLEGESELIKRFNEYFYSAADYGIIAKKPLISG